MQHNFTIFFKEVILKLLLPSLFIVLLVGLYLHFAHVNPFNHYYLKNCAVNDPSIEWFQQDSINKDSSEKGKDICLENWEKNFKTGQHFIACYLSEEDQSVTFINPFVPRAITILGILILLIMAGFRIKLYFEQLNNFKEGKDSSEYNIRRGRANLTFGIWTISIFLIFLPSMQDYANYLSRDWRPETCKIIDTCTDKNEKLRITYEKQVGEKVFRSRSFDGFSERSYGGLNVEPTSISINCFTNPEEPAQMKLLQYQPISIQYYVLILIGAVLGTRYLPKWYERIRINKLRKGKSK